MCKFTYFIRNGNMIGHFMIKRDLFVSPLKVRLPLVTNVTFSVFTLIQQDELIGWHPSRVRLKKQEFESSR